MKLALAGALLTFSPQIAIAQTDSVEKRIERYLQQNPYDGSDDRSDSRYLDQFLDALKLGREADKVGIEIERRNNGALTSDPNFFDNNGSIVERLCKLEYDTQAYLSKYNASRTTMDKNNIVGLYAYQWQLQNKEIDVRRVMFVINLKEVIRKCMNYMV